MARGRPCKTGPDCLDSVVDRPVKRRFKHIRNDEHDTYTGKSGLTATTSDRERTPTNQSITRQRGRLVRHGRSRVSNRLRAGTSVRDGWPGRRLDDECAGRAIGVQWPPRRGAGHADADVALLPPGPVSLSLYISRSLRVPPAGHPRPLWAPDRLCSAARRRISARFSITHGPLISGRAPTRRRARRIDTASTLA